MITFHNKQKPAKESLLGKFVFAEGGRHFASYSSPRLVVREMGVSLEGQRLDRTMDNGLIIATSVSEEEEISTMRKASVACVCDSLEEVNAILRANFESSNLYHASIEAGKRVLAALDGTEIQSAAAPANRTQKP